jgi:kelch-like protein 18
MQSVRFALAAATGPDGRIYAIGGYDGSGDVASVEAYDPNTDTWSFVASMNYARSAHAATTGLDGTIYSIGGDGAGVAEAYSADPLAPNTMRPALSTRGSKLGRAR